MASVPAAINVPGRAQAKPSLLTPRTRHTAISLGAVIVAYWLYSLIAVPLIEPPADPRRDDLGPDATARALAQSNSSRVRELDGLFPPDSWQLKTPKILENGRTKLLFEEYQNLGNGRMLIQPCSLVYMSAGPFKDNAERARRAVVMNAPQGALLQFDKPLQFGRSDVGHLTAGQLRGPITISSGGKLPGPEDDLSITTQDMQLEGQHAWTLQPVSFRLGPNYGSGQELHIYLAPNENPSQADQPIPSMGDVQSFSLMHVERLHLEPAKKNPSGAAPTPARLGLPGGAGDDLPVEVTCQGPFRFDMARQAATFEKQVDVWRINPNGPSDKLTCDVLTIFFGDRRAPPGAPSASKGPKLPPPGLIDLEPRSLEARGEPAIILAPSRAVEARGQRLQYDLPTGRIVLDGTEEVWLRQATNEIHAQALQYQPSPNSDLGQVLAKGPGWLRGQTTPPRASQPQAPLSPVPEPRVERAGVRGNQDASRAGQSARRPQQLEARWTQQLQVRPQDQNQVISLVGDAQLRFPEFGQLDAREIHFWLIETRPQGENQKSNFQPDRMLAQGDVRFDSPQLSGQVEHLEVWFEQGGNRGTAPARGLEQVPPASAPRATTGVNIPVPLSLRERAGVRGTTSRSKQPADVAPECSVLSTQYSPLTALPRDRLRLTAMRLPADDPPPTEPASRPQHFEVFGRLLRARLLLIDQQSELAEVMVEENVRFAETVTAQPDQQPMLITGDRIHAIEPTRPQGTVTIVGRPAHFEARQVGLTATNINLNKGTNRLWVDGPGQMTLPMDRNLDGQVVAVGGVLDVRWREAMTFDGRVARFDDSVVATAPQGSLQTETLEVHLKQAIRFDQQAMRTDRQQRPDGQQRPDVEQILCRGGVWIESQSSEPNRPPSMQRIQVADLLVNMTTGALSANGPGWLSRVSRGGDNRFGNLTALPAPASATPQPPPAQPAADDNRLYCLFVRFQGPVTGNVLRREMTCHDRVQTAYGPVDSWQATIDPDHPEALGPRGVTMRCDQLSLAQMPTPVEGRPAMEMEALGNTIVETTSYWARAMRLSYSQAKDRLELEGDGRTDAQLFEQQQIGGPVRTTAAQRIFYWPATRRVTVVQARSLDIPGAPAPPGTAQPGTPAAGSANPAARKPAPPGIPIREVFNRHGGHAGY